MIYSCETASSTVCEVSQWLLPLCLVTYHFYDSERVFYPSFQALRTSYLGIHGKELGNGEICSGSLVFLRRHLSAFATLFLMAAALRGNGNLSPQPWSVGREEDSGWTTGGASGGNEGRDLLKRVSSFSLQHCCPVRGCIKTSQKSEEGSEYSSIAPSYWEKKNQKTSLVNSLASLSYIQLLAKLWNLLDSC